MRVKCVWGRYSYNTRVVILTFHTHHCDLYLVSISVYLVCTLRVGTLSVGIIVYISVHWNWYVILSLFIFFRLTKCFSYECT